MATLAKVRIPTPLRKLTNEQETVAASGTNIGQLLEDLEKQYPGIKERLCDEQGQLRRFVNVYLNDEDIRFLQGQNTAIKDGDEVSIVPAIAGG
ncbi:MAG: MoaD/ThiS family protein [Verrucomicrobiae bacterium]|nr:MoaD/ThiS family protein [Verrucomicrobiae bacterium]